MTEDFEYRGYCISSNGANYVARSVDGEELALVSRDIERVTTAIDQMWDGLEDGTTPVWFHEPATIDLDHPSIAHHFEVQQELPIEQPLSVTRLDPILNNPVIGQVIVAFAALAIAAPIAAFMHCQLEECEPEIIFTLAVCAVALVGAVPALILSVLSAGVFNFVAVPPIGRFTSPSREELVYVLFNILAAIGIPMLLEKVVRGRRDRVHTPST